MIFKSIKKAFLWTSFLLLLLVLLIGGGYLALRSPKVQTKITQYIAGKLSEELKTTVAVEGVDIGFFNRVILEGLYVEDLRGDTLAYLTDLHLGLRYISIEKQQVYLSKVRLDNVKFYLRKYKGEEKLNLQFLIDYFSVPKDSLSAQEPWDLRSNSLELRNAAFQLHDNYAATHEIGADYKHLDIRQINLLIDGIRIDVDTIHGNVRKLNCIETHGFTLNNFQGLAKVSPHELKVDQLKLETPSTQLDLDLHYTYSGWEDYKTFVDSVRMDYDFRPSSVNLKDVAFFAPVMHGLEEELRLSGKVYGPVSSLNARNLILEYGSATRLVGNVDMDGLPNIQETFLYLDLKRLTTNYRDLRSIPQLSGKSLTIPPTIANLGKLDFKGNFTGFFTDFVAYGKLNTAIGSLNTDISLKQEQGSGKIAYRGEMQSQSFDIGKFLDEEKLGRVTLSAKVDGSGLTKEDINATLDGQVQSAEILGYEYTNVDVNGAFARSMFTGEILANDTNLNLVFRGGFDLSQELPQFNFLADVRHANLYELNVLRKRENARVSGVVEVDFIGDDIDNLVGLIEVTNGTYQQEEDQVYSIDRFSLNVEETKTSKSLELRSGILDATFDGTFSFRNIDKAVNNLMRKHLPSYAGEFEPLDVDEPLQFDFMIDLKNTEILSYLFVPELEVSDSAMFQGNYSSVNDEIYLRGRLEEVKFKTVQIENLQIEAENPGKDFQLGFFADRINLTDSIFLQSFDIRSFTFNDSLGVVVKWNNESKLKNEGFIQGIASFPKNQEVSFRLKESQIAIAGLDWTVEPSNLLKIDTTAFAFTSFKFYSELQSIGVNGKISRDPNAKLKVNLKNFDLSNFNVVTQPKGLNLGGRVSGLAEISGLYDELFLTNQLKVDSLNVNDVAIGSGEINNTWIPATRSVQVFGLLERGDQTSLSVVGEFMPGDDRPQNFNLKANIDRIPLSLFDPYIEKVITDVKGTAKADITLKGTTKKPLLSGTVDLNDADVLFTYLNTRFRISDRVRVEPDGFYFDELSVVDEREKVGKINGWVKHDAFKKFRFDARIDVQDFMVLNTTSALNQLYYGKAFASGNARFYGEPKDMHLELAMRTERGTKFNIPLNGTRDVSESDFITFVKPKGSEEEQIKLDDEFQVTFQNLTLDMDVEVTSDAEVQILFDPQVGDILKGKGDGDLTMTLDREGNFRMFGDYYINKGEYLFTLQNIINKKFLIRQGGTINWSGSPYQALIDITAEYGVRTSLYDLMFPDTSDVYKRRIQVDCILKMTDQLTNPNIAFDIDLPNSDQAVLTEVKNRIGINNEQEMNRQVFGLLVLNRFFPTENQNQALQQTGGFFTSSTSEMISNQLSNWLSKISNDFDIGVNYRPGDDITSDELQASLSTQLFNNRIIIDGNVGVANVQSVSSNIVGDVNIEYKITSDGRFRVRAFNQSNDINALNDNAPFTQGVGLSYQKEFDRIGDLFRKRKKEDYMK
jgi:hypothetical protein